MTILKIITIHHECRCRIEISHSRGRNFYQGRGLQSPWLNSDPEGEISLFHIDRLMLDCFSPHFSKLFFLLKHKKSLKRKINHALLIGLAFIMSLRVYFSGMKMGVNIVCNL